MANIKNESFQINLASIVNYIKLHHDYKVFSKQTEKYLLVEGDLDRQFFEKQFAMRVQCVVVSNIIKNRAALSSSSFKSKSQTQNVKTNIKSVIYEVIVGLAKFPAAPWIKPSGMEKWPLYGIIDLDFNDEVQYEKFKKLFVTETHDLETMILATDENVLSKVNCDFTEDQIKKAFFMAYQMAFIRKNLPDDLPHTLEKIQNQSGEVDFPSFFDGLKMNLSKLITLLAKDSSGINPKTFPNLLQKKEYKKYFTEEGIWNQDYDSFDIKVIKNFWKLINGHDFLQLLKLQNEIAKNIFCALNSNVLNRAFEAAIIENYNSECFEKTTTYKKMFESGMIADNNVEILRKTDI
ncbi:MAG: hypothetical protein IJQ31_04325 [Thermoguttaceae bacterium]|nr:hypothetical protein [Thermoguttaceae bacterium]